MTHKQTWTEIAEAYLTPEGEATREQGLLANMGLCRAIGYLEGPASFIISLNRPGSKSLGWFPYRGDHDHGRKHDLMRGDMATLFSCMTEKEFNLLLAGTPAQQ